MMKELILKFGERNLDYSLFPASAILEANLMALDEKGVTIKDLTGFESGLVEFRKITVDMLQEASDFEELMDWLDRLYVLPSEDLDKVNFLLWNGSCIDEALEKYEDVVVYESMSMRDVAIDFVENGGIGEVPENLKRYIDYDAIANDLKCEGYYVEKNGNVYYWGGVES